MRKIAQRRVLLLFYQSRSFSRRFTPPKNTVKAFKKKKNNNVSLFLFSRKKDIKQYIEDIKKSTLEENVEKTVYDMKTKKMLLPPLPAKNDEKSLFWNFLF